MKDSCGARVVVHRSPSSGAGVQVLGVDDDDPMTCEGWHNPEQVVAEGPQTSIELEMEPNGPRKQTEVL